MFPLFCCWVCQRTIFIGKNGICCFCQATISQSSYCFSCGNRTHCYTKCCGRCRAEQNWDFLVKGGEFLPPLSSLIHQFKFHKAYYLDRCLARILLLAIKNARREMYFAMPDVIIPVPLHHKRWWQRGYNQSELIALQLGKWLNIPVEMAWIERQVNTPSQRGLTAKARHKNICNAFKLNLKNPQNYQRIAIVDDVFTTGATTMEICRLFRRAGVKEIYIWVVATA